MSLAERLLNYCNQILDGEIKACKKHKWAVKRFIRDLERIENEDYPYYFDGEELKQFYEWAKMFKHKEGIIANQPIELTDWQLFVVANIFCWKKKKNGTRRFSRVYIQVARKQGKSQLQALIATYVGFLSDQKEQIYIAGVTKEQSKIVYQQILDQIANEGFLKHKFKTSYGQITHLKSGSIIQPLSKESKKTGDGKFPSLNIIDEYHAHPTSEIFDVLLSGQIGRKNALHVVITTAGLDLNAPCYQEYQYCSKILDPDNVVENDTYFVMICELDEEDDIKDESNWIKANPIVATYEEGMQDLRDRLQVALEIPDKMTEFLTKHMNRWVQNKPNGYMNLAKWNECGIKDGESLPDLHRKTVYIGIDLSATLDLTSVAFIIPIGNGKSVVLGHSFMPAENMRAKIKMDKVPYDSWERLGWLTTTEGDVVDYQFVQKYIDDIVEKYQWEVEALCYDDWNATQFINEAMNKGYYAVKVVQGIKSLYPPTKKFRELVYQRKIIHDNNPVLNWAFGNAMTKVDPNLNFMLDKSKSIQRIDPVASIMTGFAQAMHHDDEGLSAVYTDDYLDKLGW